MIVFLNTDNVYSIWHFYNCTITKLYRKKLNFRLCSFKKRDYYNAFEIVQYLNVEIIKEYHF